MKRELSTLLILIAFLLIGCDKKGNSSPTKPPIAIEVVAPAVAHQMADRLAERFLRVGEVRFDESANVYHVEVFCRAGHADHKERRDVLEFSRQIYSDRPNLMLYMAEFNLGLTEEGDKGSIPITIDGMMTAKNHGQQDGAQNP